jgi:hypothetical protein
MATSMVIDQEKFPQVVREWLSASGVARNTPIELHFLDDEVIIRPQSAERQELREWLDNATRRYDTLLKRLAEA